MKELIKITEQNGQRAVSARELYEFLGFDVKNWSRWYQKNIENNEFAFESVDYQTLFIMKNGNETKDFALTIDFAKKLAMKANSAKGEEVREYFINCEKIAKQIKPLSQLEILAQSAQILLEQERKINQVQEQVHLLEAKITTRPEYFTIAGYATLQKIDCGLKLASSLGRKASKLCKERGIETEEIPDPRFGLVKTYPTHILKEVFDLPITA